MSDDRRLHWENAYSTKGEADVSWFQESPAPSLDLIHLVQAKQSDAIVDVGGGARRLVDSFLAEGLGHRDRTSTLGGCARQGAKAAWRERRSGDLDCW